MNKDYSLPVIAYKKQGYEKALSRPLSGSEEVKKMAEHLKKLGWGESNDKYRMDGNKLLWHLDRARTWVGSGWEGGERIAPLHIDLGITTGCNLGCKYCYGVEQERDGFLGKQAKMKHMSLETITRLFDDAKKVGVRSIAIIGEGENTLNPALYPALDYARQIKLDVSLATHGRNIKDEDIDTLLSTLSWLRVNISAADRDSYLKIHQQPWFDKVIDNTKKLINAKKSKGYDTTIGYQMVIINDNMDQIAPLAKLGRNLGLDYTVLKACSDTPDRRFDAPDKAYLALIDTFKLAESYSTENYKVIVRWNKLGNMGNKTYRICHGTSFIIAISGDGTVFPCGHWFANERERFNMGNINETSFEEIIKSEKYWKAQQEIHCVDLRFCETNCRQHGLNQTLDEIANQSDPVAYVNSLERPNFIPEHINFI